MGDRKTAKGFFDDKMDVIGEEIDLDINYNLVEQKIKTLVDIKRGKSRKDTKIKTGIEEEYVPELEVVDRNTGRGKTLVTMKPAKIEIRERKEQKIGVEETTEGRIDKNKIDFALRANIPTPGYYKASESRLRKVNKEEKNPGDEKDGFLGGEKK